MTNIYPDRIIPGQDALSKVSTPSKPKGKVSDPSDRPLDFSRVLSAELESLSSVPPDETTGTGGLPELEATLSGRISQAQTVPADSSDIPGSDAASLAAAIVDRLDTYARDLADPETSLRKAHGLLEEIDTEIQTLLTRMDETDSRLKGIVDHMASLVAVEKIKLNRGDYL